MALLGAAVAMWWEMEEAMRAEFQDWHSHEQFPERMAIPGFRRGSCWTAVDDENRFFVLYELAEYSTLASAAYRARLDDPTPWSVRMMSHHRDMVRSQCRVRDSVGSLAGAGLGALRLSPHAGREAALRGQALEDAGAVSQPLPETFRPLHLVTPADHASRRSMTAVAARRPDKTLPPQAHAGSGRGTWRGCGVIPSFALTRVPRTVIFLPVFQSLTEL